MARRNARRTKNEAPPPTSAGRGTGELVTGRGLPAGAPGAPDTSGPVANGPRPTDPGPPASTLGGALAVTFLCLSPLGALALIYALQVRPRWKRGDVSGARHAADMADRLTYAAVGLQVLLAFAGLVVLIAWWLTGGRSHGA